MIKPIPVANADTRVYWDAAQEQRLVFQRCHRCDHVLSYPRSVCPVCQDGSPGWEESGGRGRIASFSIVRRGPTKAFQVPYVLALIDFDEGFRMMMNVLEETAESQEEISIGDRVIVIFENRGAAGVKIPQVKRDRQG